jgi:luciferase family oxidoreductase group 1
VSDVKLSVLDLSPIVEGGNAAQSFRNTLDLARHVEALGYHRFWLAEHHNIPSVASAATAILIEHVASGTKTIRVGAGGIMLPNHSPLVIAEQFGTLESLHPGRIDLALGRAPGSDQLTAAALRRTPQAGDMFPQDVMELMSYFRDDPDNAVHAVPGAGLDVPITILGSSLFGAQLAAHLGLPFAFASHFAPQLLSQAIEIYRTRFRPSDRLEQPYLILGANVVAADTDDEARYLFTSYEQSFVNLRRGRPMPVPPPVKDYELPFTPIERAQLEPVLGMAMVGGVDTIRRRLREFIAATGADEIIVASQLFDHAMRLRSYTIAMEAHSSPGR